MGRKRKNKLTIGDSLEPPIVSEKIESRDAKRKTGAGRMIELGYKQLQLWLDPSEFKRLQEVAAAEFRTPTNWAKMTLASAIADAKFLTTAELAALAKKELNNERF